MSSPSDITPDMIFIELTSTDLEMLCSSKHWQQLMMQKAPFMSRQHVVSCANQAFDALVEADWLEAFSGHPMIGNLDSLKKKYAQGAALSAQEQSSTELATHQQLQTLLNLNQQYLDRFGFIFIVCATGQSVDSMLIKLKQRINGQYRGELENAAIEQRKITLIRLDNLILENVS